MQSVISGRQTAYLPAPLFILFVLNALGTIAFVLLAVVNVYTQITFPSEGQLSDPAGAIRRAETNAVIVCVLSALGITDAVAWATGRPYAGYLMVIYSILHFGYLAYLYIGNMTASVDVAIRFYIGNFLCSSVFLIPLVIDGLVIWRVGKKIVSHPL